MLRIIFCGMLILGLFAEAAFAQRTKVRISEAHDVLFIQYQGKRVKVMRLQDPAHRLSGGFAKTSRPCPPFCFQPMQVVDGVKTVGEIETVAFMADQYTKGTGLIIDARLPSWYQKGTIPGAVNMPFTSFDPNENDEKTIFSTLRTVGVRKKLTAEQGFLSKVFNNEKTQQNTILDFSQAKQLLLFCNGPWCGQSPAAIKNLIALGYPKDKLLYYRGGMQLWQLGAFTTVIPEK